MAYGNPVIQLGQSGTGTYGGSFTLINISQKNPPSTGIVCGASGLQGGQVVAINYVDTSTPGWPQLYPFYSLNPSAGGVLYRTGTYAGRVDSTGTLGTTAGSATVLDSNAVSGDANKTITGTGIPPGSSIYSVTQGTGYTVHPAANATGTPASLTIGGIPAASTYGETFYYATDTEVLYHSNGTAWTPLIFGSSITDPQINLFTAGGTWTKPAGAQTVFAAALPGGGGAGSGASGTSGTVLCGGGGGAAGLLAQRQFIAADLPSTVTVTVGAGGTGGAAVTGLASPRVDTTAGGTNTTTTVTDANAVTGDLGRSISGTNIPAGAYITAVTSGGGVGYTISAAATGGVTSSITFTIGAFTVGSNGTGGGNSSFGSYLSTTGGSQGSGGTTTTGTGGGSQTGISGNPQFGGG